MLRTIFVIANLGITLGYMYVAVFVAPHFKLRYLQTRMGGVVFFVTCGLTHFEHAAHAMWSPNEKFYDIATSWHMVVIHVIQVIAVWAFVTGLYREFVLPGRIRELVREKG